MKALNNSVLIVIVIGIELVSECLIGAEKQRDGKGEERRFWNADAETMNIVEIKQSHSPNLRMIDGSSSTARIASKILENRSILIPTHSPPKKIHTYMNVIFSTPRYHTTAHIG